MVKLGAYHGVKVCSINLNYFDSEQPSVIPTTITTSPFMFDHTRSITCTRPYAFDQVGGYAGGAVGGAAGGAVGTVAGPVGEAVGGEVGREEASVSTGLCYDISTVIYWLQVFINLPGSSVQ